MAKETKKLNDVGEDKITKKSSAKGAKSKVKAKEKVSSPAKTQEKKPVAKKTTKTKKAVGKSVARKPSEKNTSAKKVTTKKTSSAKKTTKKTTTKKKSNIKEKATLKFIEYYDLPYRYNQTIVKVLAQTPTNLFVYWDISDKDREKFAKEFGKDFFNTTYPVLIVHNKTYNYSFEIPINDFANSWYFAVNDAKCEYIVELGRRAKSNEIILPNNYVYVSSSNKIEAPNDHILFEKTQNAVYFRNTKNNEVISKDIVNLQFIQKIGKIYNIYEVYKKIYKDETVITLDNPTSINNPTSNI